MQISADVIVVGGGVIGASIAWRLARSGVQVVLLDAAGVGAEASSAAAGMLSPAGEFEAPSPQLDFALASLKQYPEFTASIESDSGCKVELRRPGAVQVAISEQELRSLAARAAGQRSSGINSRILSRRQLQELVPLVRDDTVGGIYYPDELTVDPPALMRALRQACLARKVSLAEGARVLSLASGSKSVRALLPDRAPEAAFAVIAAGAWSHDVGVSIAGKSHPLPQSFPVKGHLVGYRLEPGSLPATVRHGHTYVLQRAGGFTVAGSSMENAAYDRSINAAVVADIRSRASALLPILKGLEPERVWTGFRPATPAQAPHIGPLTSSRIWLAYGHYRNGILLAPATAQRVAEGICASLHH